MPIPVLLCYHKETTVYFFPLYSKQKNKYSQGANYVLSLVTAIEAQCPPLILQQNLCL